MSTDDGQDVIGVELADTLVTPCPHPCDVPGEDEARRLTSDAAGPHHLTTWLR